MGKDMFWKRFEQSGSIKDYLEYACTSEDDMYDDAYAYDYYDDDPDDYDGYDDDNRISMY